VWPGAVFSPGRFGIVHPSLPWREVMEAYYWDNLKVAMDLAEESGLGLNGAYLGVFRTIEAEHVAREEGRMSDRGDWLLVEHVPVDEEEDDLPWIEALVREQCGQTAEAFGHALDHAVLFTFLHPTADVPFVPGRQGYFVDKYPFDKICLPSSLLRRPDELKGAVRHEFAHAMALNRSQGKCPLWLHEAVAMVAQDGIRRRVRRLSTWRNPVALESAFRQDRETPDGSATVREAYAQAAVLGSYLADQGGVRELGRLLDAFTDNGLLQSLWMQTVSQKPEDEALRQVFGFGLKALFERAEAWSTSDEED